MLLKTGEDAGLWVVSAAAALGMAFFLCLAAGFLRISPIGSWKPTISPPSGREITASIVILPSAPADVAAPAAPLRKPFARTDDSPPGEKPRNAAYQGDRDSTASAELDPVADAPPLPSQTGRERKNDETDLADTRFHEGDSTPAPATPERRPAPVSPPASAAKPSTPLLAGPNPVDVPVPKPLPEERPPPPRPAPKDPAFRSEQRKTSLVGSLSRGKQSSLDVEDTPLGRYQSAVSRAVELEWQRNCVRRRDFIVPGFLTARFTVGPDGKVKTVAFEGEMEGGQVQKGFTLDSIRDAAIPPMPAALRKEYAKDPLELVFRFFF